MESNVPFGIAFAERRTAEVVELPYDSATQTCDLPDGELADLAASCNTLTYTSGDDNDTEES